jgi:hypothetical protein
MRLAGVVWLAVAALAVVEARRGDTVFAMHRIPPPPHPSGGQDVMLIKDGIVGAIDEDTANPPNGQSNSNSNNNNNNNNVRAPDPKLLSGLGWPCDQLARCGGGEGEACWVVHRGYAGWAG